MNNKVKTVYIAGPISSDPELYREKFEAAAWSLFGARLSPFNPADILSPLDEKGVDYSVILQCCLNIVKCCDAIALLPNWRESRGAKEEFRRYCMSRDPWECVFFELEMYPDPHSRTRYNTVITRFDGLGAWRNKHGWEDY